MTKGFPPYLAFRIAFFLLGGAALLLLTWQCSRGHPLPSRVEWSPAAPAKP